MAFITYKYQTAECPQWGEKIQIQGKYLYLENNSHKARFLSATCPIEENLRLPRAKRNPDYKFFAFCKNSNCPLLNDFPEFIEE